MGRRIFTNSVDETLELRKLEFVTRLLERGYPSELAKNILAGVKCSSRKEALQTKQKHPEIFCLSQSRHWQLITESNRLDQIYSDPPIFT